MWMWYKPLRQDVFVAAVETTELDTWVLWFDYNEGRGWKQDRIGNFEPPHKH